MTMGSAIRTGAILLIVVSWGSITAWAVVSIVRVCRVQSPDSGEAIRVLKRTLLKNPFSPYLEPVRERPDLLIALEARDGYSSRLLQGGEVISGSDLVTLRQYLLTVRNPSKEVLSAIDLRLQLPYPIESHEVARQEGVTNADLSPTTLTTLAPINGGSVHIGRRPLYADYRLQIAQLAPGGRLELLVLLNNRRNPRGGRVTMPEDSRPIILQVRPEVTYVAGQYRYEVAGETITQDYYAPFEVDADKTVSLRTGAPRPERLVMREGVE